MQMLRFSFVVCLIMHLSPMGCTTNHQNDNNTWVAFSNVNLISMTSDKVTSNQTVLINNDRIVWIGSTAEEELPDDATVIDGEGLFLMPGLADMHVHLAEFNEPVPVLHMFLANGITTIRNCEGGFGRFILNWKAEIEHGERIGPRILSAGEGFVFDQSNVSERVLLQKELGFDQVKIYWALSVECFNELVETAKQLNLYTIGHIPFIVGLEGVLNAGMDEIAHIEEVVFSTLVDYDYSRDLADESAFEWYDVILRIMADELEARDNDIGQLITEKEKYVLHVVRQLLDKGTVVGTTLYVDRVVHEKLHAPLEFINQPDAAYMIEKYKAKVRAGEERHQVQFRGMENELLSYKIAIDSLLLVELNKAGVRLLCGTDSNADMGVVPGFSLFKELEIMVKYGLTPYEALRTATANVAIVMEEKTGHSDIGTIEVGKRADLILLSANPMDDIDNLRQKRGVMVSGNWYLIDELNEMIRIEDSLIPKAGSTELMITIEEEGMDAAVERYWRAKKTKNKKNRIDVNPLQLADLAASLLDSGKLDEPIVIHQLIADEMPEKWYAQYMLGQAYMKDGQARMARGCYNRALELNPDSKPIRDALEQLE